MQFLSNIARHFINALADMEQVANFITRGQFLNHTNNIHKMVFKATNIFFVSNSTLDYPCELVSRHFLCNLLFHNPSVTDAKNASSFKCLYFRACLKTLSSLRQ